MGVTHVATPHSRWVWIRGHRSELQEPLELELSTPPLSLSFLFSFAFVQEKWLFLSLCGPAVASVLDLEAYRGAQKHELPPKLYHSVSQQIFSFGSLEQARNLKEKRSLEMQHSYILLCWCTHEASFGMFVFTIPLSLSVLPKWTPNSSWISSTSLLWWTKGAATLWGGSIRWWLAEGCQSQNNECIQKLTQVR